MRPDPLKARFASPFSISLALLLFGCSPVYSGGSGGDTGPDDTGRDVIADTAGSDFDSENDADGGAPDVEPEDGGETLEGDHPDLALSNLELVEDGHNRTGEYSRDISALLENVGEETATSIMCENLLEPLPGEPEDDSASGEVALENPLAPGEARDISDLSVYIRANDNDDDNFDASFRLWCRSPDEPEGLEGNNEVSKEVFVEYF